MADRRAREELGRKAESRAAFYLRCRGYHIIEQRFKTPQGEIDLIAQKGREVIFIEVKYRSEEKFLATSLTPAAQKRITKAAHFYVSHHPQYQRQTQRFDLIWVWPNQHKFLWPKWRINHMKDAFRAY